MEILEKMFGGAVRVKLMRLFLFNPLDSFSSDEISTRAKVDSSKMKRELNFLNKVGLIRKKNIKGKRGNSWALNDRFPYLGEFRRLLIETSLMTPNEIAKRLSKIGKLKLVILSGVFKEQWESTLDVLIVADGVKKSLVEGLMAYIEAEMGKELRYAALETEDFKYRLGVGDRLIRDVLDYPHHVAIDKLNLF